MRRVRKPLVALAAVLALGLLALGLFLGGHPSALPGFARSWFVGNDESLVQDVYGTIRSDFYRQVPRSQLVNGAISGAVASLDDPYAEYYTPSAYHHYQAMTDAQFTGIGVDVTSTRKGLRVVKVIHHTPAQRAGLRSGDVITAVDGHSLAGVSLGAATNRIEGREGTPVRLRVLRHARTRTVRVEREKIEVPVVQSRLLHRHGVPIADVALASFTNGAHEEVRQALEKELHKGAKGIVLDLRGNGGGLVEEAVLVASIFIPEGTIVSTDGRSRPRRVYTAQGHAIDPHIPMVVLVDHDTASAAEIVTGALQDHRRATVVGVPTYGKGVFQEVKRLPNGGALALTVGEYFTPNGDNLGGGGVKRGAGIQPDVRAKDDPATPRRDEAMQRALGVLAAKIG